MSLLRVGTLISSDAATTSSGGTYTPSLNFSDARNSQYAPFI